MRKLFIAVLSVVGTLALGSFSGPAQARMRGAEPPGPIVTVEGTLEQRPATPSRWIDRWVADADGKARTAPSWVLKQGGAVYPLDLQDNAKLLALARKMNGKKVAVTGRVETWTIHRRPRPGPDGTVILIGCLPQRVQVFVVVGLREVE
jgi:hypothetical protein